MKIIVVGAGAIGGVVGGLLAKAGCDVTLLDVAAEHVKAMRENGLTLVLTDGSREVIPVKAATVDEYIADCKEAPQCILLCVKGQFTETALAPFVPLMDENSFVISIQNGLNEYKIAEMVGKERTVSGFVNIFSDYLEPGVINYGGEGALVIGEMDGSMTPRMDLIRKEFKGIDQLEISDNVLGYLWAKLGYAMVLIATTLTNETMADCIDDPRYRDMFIELSAETYEVATKEGFKLPEFDDYIPDLIYPRENRDPAKLSHMLDVHVARLRGYTKVHSGFWRDLVVRKRKSEISVFEDPIRECAAKHGVEIPLTDLTLKMFHELEEGTRPFTMDNLDILAEEYRRYYLKG